MGGGDSPPPTGLPERCGRPHPLAALEQTGWRIPWPDGAAALMGLKPTTIEPRIKKLGLQRRASSAQSAPPAPNSLPNLVRSANFLVSPHL